MVAEAALPTCTRVYQNHHLDSTRWDAYRRRPGDVIISTSMKAGTTWMQRILSLLVFGAGPLPDTLWNISPWLDERFHPETPQQLADKLEAQAHQRFIKAHIPLDALPYYPDVKYIYVGRDTRDVFMSMFNHYSAYTDFVYQILNGGDRRGEEMPRCPAEPRELWLQWMARGNFEWESDGWPFWSHHYHAESFWKFRHLPNVLLVHYADLKADTEGQMRRVADFVGIEVEEENWPELVAAAGFEAMRRDGDALMGADIGMAFQGGADRFLHKGTNGRWLDVLTPEDLQLYERASSKLDPDLRRWLESGSLLAGNPQPR
ncbi:MAG: sulfotransferase domain-containing protein [Dehalococcoidia bacterium]